MKDQLPGPARLAALLRDEHGWDGIDLEPLRGGFWSAAYAFRAAGRDLVLRVGTIPEGFAMDAAAHRLAGDRLPVPEVLSLGTVDGYGYAVSERRFGRFLEDVEPAEAAVAGQTLGRLLARLRSVAAPPGWLAGGPEPAWHDWLRLGLTDRPGTPQAGWRAALSPEASEVFVDCEHRIAELIEACPQRRDVVHGDLLYKNVLITPDAGDVTAVFSWKCSVLGDFLYDTAWCTYWSSYHPGIEAADPWARTLDTAGPEDLADAGVRHHVYELQIGASHLGFHTWAGMPQDVERGAARLRGILEHGPRQVVLAAQLRAPSTSTGASGASGSGSASASASASASGAPVR